MPLVLESLSLPTESLERALEKSRDSSFTATHDPVGRELVTLGVIHRFEVAYDRCWKFMKRWLETNVSPAIADGVTRRELFRLAAESRLIDDVEQWMRYHDARNQTSHTDEPAAAQRVYQSLAPFSADARKLLEALVARND